ncbi:hypothetical protein TVAG_235270 [Trichomonas vaginalis G3]|uniref:receptor protein-tyrosine kinase n=1 Tax=Trichomonas vaginalis (strain ATCC PRA-98 / G3) TaxID=412133 RepID=A2DPP5_TRIV3|nr:glycine-rich protein family [Trichomonas vaginalis G3]EAY17645.1 hypothetical protein TVAG_235270 [Trichomonas vaginalis G3]KAI5486111.1 glycine-rich protein family [Trichomonas vaginalis G3]|eukprot:XP_001329780.1 hypothetical protein [Trichomonas vaginalis G3]
MGGNSSPSEYSLSGGGSGYFGGGGASVTHNKHGSGAGGSSYVSGCNGYVSVSRNYSLQNSISFNGTVHYSGLFFTNIRMLSGDELLPNYSSTKTNSFVSYVHGHLGDGAFKITLLECINICSNHIYVNLFSYSQFFSLSLLNFFIS